MGVENVVQVMTNKATTYIVVGRLLNKYPTLFWSLCPTHCIELILVDIGKFSRVQNVVLEAKHLQNLS